MTTIMIDLIDPNPEQPRVDFDPLKLTELAASIKEKGIIQPITVQKNGNGRYILHDGERRLRAAKMADLTEIPAHIAADADPKELLIRATVANVQRADLTAMELAQAYQKMADLGMTDQEIADQVGKSRSSIANTRRLMKLPLDMVRAVQAGQISARIATAYLPALDIKSHELGEASPPLNKQPTFGTWDTPTPAALRRRLLDPEKYGGSLSSGEVRRFVDKIKDACTPEPCQGCGVNLKLKTVQIGKKDYCQKCTKELTEDRYCPSCSWDTNILKAEIEQNKPIQCSRCHKQYPAQDFLTYFPSSYKCHKCNQKTLEINARAHSVKCHHCEHTWDSIAEYHQDRQSSNKNSLPDDPPRKTYGKCANCNQELTGPGWTYKWDLSKRVCDLCSKEHASVYNPRPAPVTRPGTKLKLGGHGEWFPMPPGNIQRDIQVREAGHCEGCPLSIEEHYLDEHGKKYCILDVRREVLLSGQDVTYHCPCGQALAAHDVALKWAKCRACEYAEIQQEETNEPLDCLRANIGQQTDPPPLLERLLIYVSFEPPIKPKWMIGWYDDDRQEWRWEAGSISGMVTHWQPLPDKPDDQ